MNDNYSQLVTRRIENLNVNDCHLAQGDSGQTQRQLGSCNLGRYLLSLTLFSANINWHESCMKSGFVYPVSQFNISGNNYFIVPNPVRSQFAIEY